MPERKAGMEMGLPGVICFMFIYYHGVPWFILLITCLLKFHLVTCDPLNYNFKEGFYIFILKDNTPLNSIPMLYERDMISSKMF